LIKVLFASAYNHPNSVVKTYIDAIAPRCELVSGIENFWNSTLRFDIVHVQWPEELLGWGTFDRHDLDRLRQCLLSWKNSGARIVMTRHNAVRHGDFPLNANLYELSFGIADAIVHLGKFSLDEFKDDRRYSGKLNVLINHPDYLNVPNTITKQAARKKLMIELDSFLYLSFGTIRSSQEQEDLVNAFKKVTIKNKKLLLTNSLYLEKIIAFRASPLKNMRYKRDKLRLKRSGIIIDETRNISINCIQDYCNAADVIVIPRIKQLNSGVPYLAFSFSKPVVGPDVGNIGWLLKATSNGVYMPGDVDSYGAALQKAGAWVEHQGASNYQFVTSECAADKVAKEHVLLYQKLQD
jgi:hypothetical protein